MSFLDSGVGVAAGEFGTLLKTTDGGVSWTVLSVDRRWYVRSVAYTRPGHLIVLATEPPVYMTNVVLRSTDDGTTWEEHPLDSAKQYQAMSFSDSLHGIIVGGSGTVLKSTDGGQTWNPRPGGTTRDLFGVQFSDALNAIAVGDFGTILRTTDGGETWDPQSSPSAAVLWAVSCVDSSTAWICGRGSTILGTTDAGTTWQPKNSGTFFDLWSIAASTGNGVVAVGWNGTGGNTISSTDGGATWIDTTTGPNVLKSVRFIDGDVVVAAGDDGAIHRSTNGGVEWTPVTQSIGSGYYDVRFINENVGMIAGDAGTILRTGDGGGSWTAQSTGAPFSINAVDLLDTSTAIAVGSGGDLLRTTDGGQAWTAQAIGAYDWLTDVDFLSSNLGMVTEAYGLILKTTNGGQSWTELPSGATYYLSAITMVSPSVAIAVGQVDCCPFKGRILRTTNGGTSWSVVLGGDTVGGLSDVAFTTSLQGVAVGSGIYRTTNGGAAWFPVAVGSPASFLLSSVSFSDQSNGFAAGFDGAILRTTDGGSSWTPQESNTGLFLRAIAAQGSGKAIAVGERSTILRTVTGGEITAVGNTPGPGTLPRHLLLSQNYPNPFNPLTTIDYHLPAATHVRLTVVDLLGREVLRLVDEFQHAGGKSVSVRADHLPSGVYLYRLTAGTLTETRKLVVVR